MRIAARVEPVQLASAQPSSGAGIKRLARLVAGTILYILGACLVWETVYLLAVELLQIWPAVLFPAPLAVMATLLDRLADGSMLRAGSASLARLLIGYGLALPLGITGGLSLSRSRSFKALFGPLVLGMQTLPSICWLPLAILWLGLNEQAIIFVIIMGSVFSITSTTHDGTKLMSPLLLKAAANLGIDGWPLFLRVILPAALPAILGGARQGWSFAWRSLLAGELLTAGIGLGNLLNQGRDLTDMSLVMAVMVVIIALGLLVDQVVFSPIERIIAGRYGLSGIQAGR